MFREILRKAGVTFSSTLLAAAAGGVLGVFGAAADASIILNNPTVVGNGNPLPSVIVTSNSIVIAAKNFTGLGPIDIVFTTANDGATDTYTVAEAITNSVIPAITWTDYEEQLGSGAADNFDVGDTSVIFAGPISNTSSNTSFTDAQLQDHTIELSQGSVASEGTLSVGFELTAPDLPDGTTFTLRQFPTIPEPVSLPSLAAGLFLMLRRPHGQNNVESHSSADRIAVNASPACPAFWSEY